jgi:DNA-binding response OmpR family regulator
MHRTQSSDSAGTMAPEWLESNTGGASAIRSYLMALRAAADRAVEHIDLCLAMEERYAALSLRQRHALPESVPERDVIAGDFVLDPLSRTLRHGTRVHQLSPSQFLIMLALMRAEGRPLTRDQLNVAAGVRSERSNARARSLDQQVLHLRKMLEKTPRRPRYLLTVRGVGYRFDYGEIAAPQLARHTPHSLLTLSRTVR